MAVAAEIRMETRQRMVLAVAVAAAMEMAAAAAAAVLTPRFWADQEALGEPRVSTQVAVAARQAITVPVPMAAMLEVQEQAPETKAQRVQHSPKLDRVEDPIPVVVASAESVLAVAAVVASMGLPISAQFFWDPAAAAAAAMIVARSAAGPEVMAAEAFSLLRILLRSRERLPVMAPPVSLLPPVKEQAVVDPVGPF